LYNVISQDKVLCKSILHEFAVKMSLEKPIYDISQPKGQLPVFKCSVAFNGATYTGEIARTKKEAEQLGARAAILSILGIFLFVLELWEFFLDYIC